MSKQRKTTENAEYFGFVRRALRALKRRVGEDCYVEDLGTMLALRDELDTIIAQSVTSLRDQGVAWSQIAEYTGTSRQAAQQRWGARSR